MNLKRVFYVILLLSVTAVLPMCKEESGTERVREEAEEAAEEAGDAIEDAGDDIEDALD